MSGAPSKSTRSAAAVNNFEFRRKENMYPASRIFSTVLLIASFVTAASAAVPPDELTVRSTYAKAEIAFELNRLKTSLYQSRAKLPTEQLHIAVSAVQLGSVKDIVNSNVGDLITKPGDYVLDAHLLTAEIPNVDTAARGFKALQVNGWNVASYLTENWAVPFSELLNFVGPQFTRYASFDVVLTYMGRQRQYRALFLFGSDSHGKEQVLALDHIIGVSKLSRLVNVPIQQEMQLVQQKFSDRPGVTRLAQSLQPEAGCQLDGTSQLCCHPLTGHCGLSGLAPALNPSAPSQIEPSLLAQSMSALVPSVSGAVCTNACSAYNSNEPIPGAIHAQGSQQHDGSGWHEGNAAPQGGCSYSGAQLPCAPLCHVHMFSVSTKDSGKVVGGKIGIEHVTDDDTAYNDNSSFSNGQESCVAYVGFAAAACLFGSCVISIEASAGGVKASAFPGGVIWKSDTLSHSWQCSTIN